MSESAGHPNVIYARAPTTLAPTAVLVDATAQALFTAGWTWNTNDTAWEKIEDLNDKLDTIISLLGDIKDNTAP